MQTDGKIVVVGATVGEIAVIRCHPDGTLDSAFGTNGVVTTDLGGTSAVARAVAIQPDGKIVAGGTYYFQDFTVTPFVFEIDFAVVRYNADGTLDAGFGTGGIVITSDTTPESQIPIADNDEIKDLVLQPDGGIVVAGRSSSFNGNRFAVASWPISTEPSLSLTGATVVSAKSWCSCMTRCRTPPSW